MYHYFCGENALCEEKEITRKCYTFWGSWALPFLLAALLLTGCSGKKEESDKTSLTESGMKCGAGKCGASMVDGDTVLAKKKKNFLSQMREDDPRKTCVLEATTTKSLYDCVRDPKTNRLTTKCGTGKCSNASSEIIMKCGAGKCGSGMSRPKVPPKPEPAKQKTHKEEPMMKCAAGKCSGK